MSAMTAGILTGAGFVIATNFFLHQSPSIKLFMLAVLMLVVFVSYPVWLNYLKRTKTTS